MIRRQAKSLIALTALATSTVAWACADPGCEGDFNLLGRFQSCQGKAMLAPGNDSRINLMLLLADRGGRTMEGLKPGQSEDRYSSLNQPSVFLDWATLRHAMFPAGADPFDAEGSYTGSRCQSFASGSAALEAAMQANRDLPDGERIALIAARAEAEAVCKSATAYSRRHADKNQLEPLPRYAALPQVTSRPGREFLDYIMSADAFYGEAWDDARNGFARLGAASDPYVRETAAYMLIRVEFAAAQAGAFDEYGDYDPAKPDRAAVKRGLEALSAYLKAYPQGRYAASAKALLRRGLWLAGNYDALSGSYAAMLARTSPDDEAAALLVEEIDTKLLFNPDARGARLLGPMLRAAGLLVDMRDSNYTEEGPAEPGITTQALDAMAPQFAGAPDLFSYLQATHAFYYGGDYRRVLQLVPDDARRPSHTNLSFSRQMLRGMALAALKDRNEGGFWQELLGGAKGPWQRPLAELGLAMHWERAGRLDAVFAAGSPIRDAAIRARLIDYSASPALLRTIVQSKASPADERDLALKVLLSGQLVFGRYGDFVADLGLPLAKADGQAAFFKRGKVSDGYPCAPIAVTAAALARNPQDIPGRLCLGEFFRLHGLDSLHGEYYPNPDKDELGGFAAGFSGQRNFRSGFYNSIIADPRAGANDKAYALYRAVMCYAPSGMNDCGGAEVPKSQRKAWFERLKRDYPQSAWAKKLRYYW